MIYLYLTIYLTLVTWCAAAFLYTDGSLVHSKKEVALSPLLGLFAVMAAGVRWGYARRRRYL